MISNIMFRLDIECQQSTSHRWVSSEYLTTKTAFPGFLNLARFVGLELVYGELVQVMALQ